MPFPSSVSPTGFGDTGDLSLIRQFAEANPAYAEFSHVRMWASADFASIICPDLKSLLALLFVNQRSFSHTLSLSGL